MKIFKVTLPISLAFVLISLPSGKANAQFVMAEIVKLTVKKVIRAIDLKVQRMQNQTIWLQNAQKVLENQLSKLRLTEITDWTDQQRSLYSKYYDELWQIKSIIAYYQRIKDMTVTQTALVRDYQRAWAILNRSGNFNPSELHEMKRIYTGILDASMKNLDQILMVMNSFKTQMTDEERLELIDAAGKQLDINYNDLRQFNEQNMRLVLDRQKETRNINLVKKLYELN